MHPLTAALLDWYDRCARDLPWRGFHDAYRTWVSEAMLQQTRVETVLSYYDRFLERFPTLSALAEAPEADVLKAWEGLGYYSRARNLHNGAMDVMEQYGGVLPRDPEKLKKIRGIGPYTAGAIASIAYDVPVPAVDGNVIRVLSRIYGIRTDALQPDTRKHIEELAASLVPKERPGDHNQAVMDLGATVCVPGTPDCARCPLSAFCDAFVHGDAPDLPLIPGKVPQKTIRWTVTVLRSGNRTLIRRRTETLLQGLWCFPMLECEPADAATILEKKYRLHTVPVAPPVHARHVFTHLIWEMDILPLDAGPDALLPPDYRWAAPGELETLVFPVAMTAALTEAKKLLDGSVSS